MNNNITEDYCSFEVSKLLKEKGFNIPCENFYCKSEKVSLGCYDPFPYNSELSEGCCSIPTHALAIKWIRENFKIHIVIDGETNYKYKYQILTWSWHEPEKTFRVGHTVLGETFWDTSSEEFNSPEEAVEAALLYTLKNLIP